MGPRWSQHQTHSTEQMSRGDPTEFVHLISLVYRILRIWGLGI